MLRNEPTLLRDEVAVNSALVKSGQAAIEAMQQKYAVEMELVPICDSPPGIGWKDRIIVERSLESDAFDRQTPDWFPLNVPLPDGFTNDYGSLIVPLEVYLEHCVLLLADPLELLAATDAP